MERWNRKHMPVLDSLPKRDEDVPGIPVTVMQYPAHASSGGGTSVRAARESDIEACAALINATHAGRDLFRPYTPDALFDRLDPGFTPSGPRLNPRPYTLADFYVVELRGEIAACVGVWDRGRDLRERWRHRETGAEREISVLALLDFGVARGHDDALAALVEHSMGMAHERGRDYVVVPLESMPAVAALLARYEPVAETRYLQWRAETPVLRTPAYLDLVYW
jgi:hypothetical protein